MDLSHNNGRASATSHCIPQSKRPRGDGSPRSHFDVLGVQEELTGFSSASVLPSSSQTQISITQQINDGESMEALPARSFIFKLYDMLQDERVKGWIRWNEAGDAIFIPSIREFESQALRTYFNIKFDSFVRQLNGWSFEKIGRSKLSGKYRHKGNKFRRGHPELLHGIKRTGHQQDQSTSHNVASLSSESPPQSQGPLDLQSKVLHLERENISLKEAFKNLETRTAMMLREMEMRTIAALKELETKFHATFSPASSKTNGQIYRAPAPHVTPRAPPDGNHFGAVSDAGQRLAIQMVNTSSVSAGEFYQLTSPDGSRPPGNFSTTSHYLTPTAIMSLQTSHHNGEQSPPSAAVRLQVPDDQYSSLLCSSSTTTLGQSWSGPSGAYQQAPRDLNALGPVLTQNNPAMPLTGSVQQRPGQNVYSEAAAPRLPKPTPSASGSSTFFGNVVQQFYATDTGPFPVGERQVAGPSQPHVQHAALQNTPGTLPFSRNTTYVSNRQSGGMAQVPLRHR